MALSPTNPATNGAGRRKNHSWIESFIEYTDNLESAEIWRKWSAISSIAAALEQKVWVTTSSPLFPNLYVFLVGRAGLGKSRPIIAGRRFMEELPEPHLAPTSVTMASLVDHLVEAKRTIINLPHEAVEYNSLYITADELSAFMHEYTGELVAGLTTFFDVLPYGQGRRVKDIKIKIKRPQLNILVGSTPNNLLNLVPDGAWEQGFMSRVIMIYSDDKPIIDVFNTPKKEMPKDMLHDLKLINALHGEFGWSEDYAKAMHNWKIMGQPPMPEHPKLIDYNSRRFSHLIKLSMVSSVDRDDSLHLTRDDFNKAMGWLLEAEEYMPSIFKAGGGSADSKAMDEILHFVRQYKDGISEHKIINFARQHVEYTNNIIPVLDIMEKSGMIKAVRKDATTGLRWFKPGALN